MSGEYDAFKCSYCKNRIAWIDGNPGEIYDVMCEECNKLRVPSLQFKEIENK